jgi:hypothetical protein
MSQQCRRCVSCLATAAAAEMVVGTGYPLEEHKVITPDGWVLNLYRIPHGKNRNTQRGRKPVAYVHHGITLSSACFTLLGEHESIAYILADAGQS